MPDVNHSWIEAELRGLRDLIAAEQVRVNERFDAEQSRVDDRFSNVNELREQVLEERGVYVRHEVLEALRTRVERLEQTGIRREDHDRLLDRVVMLERTMVNRQEHSMVQEAVGKLQSRVPILLAVASIVAAVMGYVVENVISGHMFGR